MGASELRKEIHDYIDHADDRFLRLVFSMVENELTEAGTNILSSTADDMVKRSKASLQSISEGRARNIQAFKQDIDSWKKQQSTK